MTKRARALGAALDWWQETEPLLRWLLRHEGVNVDDLRDQLRTVAHSAERYRHLLQGQRGRPHAVELGACVVGVLDALDPEGRKGAACYYDPVREEYDGWLFNVMVALLEQANWPASRHTIAKVIKEQVREAHAVAAQARRDAVLSLQKSIPLVKGKRLILK